MATIKINEKKQYQTFKSFGASGAWWAQEVGSWTHIDSSSGLSVRDRISQLLHCKEKGIGLRVYRYNLGGGSKESGKGKIDNPLRRAESFYSGPNKYDWSKDKNAVYMMKQAVKDGADEVILFANSPPEVLTKNRKTHLDKPWRENLSKKNYSTFAKYCLDVAEHFIYEGVPVKYISPINEPSWTWTGGQEGCHYRPSSVGKVFEVFAKALEERENLKGVKLSGAEIGDIRWFNKSYTRNLLNRDIVLRNLDGIDIHSYFTKIPIKFLNNRTAFMKRYRKWMDKNYPDVKLKMSEWTHMQGGRDKKMDSALEMAKIMYEDISILNVCSWQHWIAVSEVDFCDGLIYINLDDKTFETTKRLYVTANFSKFILPGSKRIDIKSDDLQLQLLAFIKNKIVTVIIINSTDKEKKLSFFNKKTKSADMYVTNKNHDLSKENLKSLEDISISSRSVNTIVFSLNT